MSHRPAPTQTNEALAALVQAGDNTAAAQLWEQNRGLLALILGRLYARYRQRADACGLTYEDFEQEGYFIILAAAKGFDLSAGSFSNYLTIHCKARAFALLRLRTEREAKDPLNLADSLETPLSTDEEGGTLADIVPDPAAPAPFEDVAARSFEADRQAVVGAAVERLPEQQRAVIRARYWEGLTRDATGKALGLSASATQREERKAFQQLRRDGPLIHWLRAEEIEARAYHGGGFSAWQHGGSVEERIVEWIERKETSEYD